MRTEVNTGAGYSPAQMVDLDLATAPRDRVRLASVVAGLLTTIATLIVLSVLGIAIGLATFDANAPSPIGLGVGIWGGISALISFGLGGFVAARSSATASGPRNGILNGAVVWMAALFLIVLLLGNGIGSLLGVAGSVASTAVTAAAPVAAQAAANPVAVATAANAAPAAGSAVSTTVANVKAQVTPARVEQTAQDVSKGAWGALLSLGLSAAASLIGGALGSRADERMVRGVNAQA